MLSKSDVEFLMSQRVGRIATVDPRSGTPHLVPICFAFDGENFFTTLYRGRKRLRNIENGSKTAFLVDAYNERNGEWTLLKGLLIYGDTTILRYSRDKGEFMQGWKLLIEKYPQYRQWANSDLTPKDPAKRRLLKISPAKVVRWGFE